jgi:NitT/TauT family transport system substrate-binding protein
VKSGRNRLAGCVTWEPKTTEVAEGSGGKAYVLTTNRNLLIVADVLVLNRGFAKKHPEMVAGLVDGLIAGNQMVRSDPKSQLAVIAKAFKWDEDKAGKELTKVHLANLPENLAFFDGTIDSAGSYGFIYESAVAAYGPSIISKPADGDSFLDLAALKALKKSAEYAEQKAQIMPIRSGDTLAEDEPLLSKHIRFLFEANVAKLDLTREDNSKNLESIAKALQVAPGSRVVLVGHAEPSLREKYRREGGEALVRKVALTAMQLSKDRAAEVGKLLCDKYQIDPSRVSTTGKGWDAPAGDVVAENRRVEMQWFPVR